MKTAENRLSDKSLGAGSALILTVVLTSLLAIVGVLFVMVSRVDKMATSAISENKELNLAVDTVVTKISRELVLDVPGVTDPGAWDPNATDPNVVDPNAAVLIQEYYDYPDVNNIWLAALEPYESGGIYYWRQISNIYNRADPNLGLQAAIVPDYQDPAVMGEAVKTDADGDGIADSRWTIIPDISSGKGMPIYAAVRIIDNAAMLNANTAFKFDLSDPNTPVSQVAGSSQTQISLLALAGRPGFPPASTEETDLLIARAGSNPRIDPLDVRAYEDNVVWRYGEPNGPYTPFDMSDELELRYRFLLNHPDIDTRLEAWGGEFRISTLNTPVEFSRNPNVSVRNSDNTTNLMEWSKRLNDAFDPKYAYRHIATTYNMDRIISPAGSALNNGKMVNVNTANQVILHAAIRAAILQNGLNPLRADSLAAQLAVNIIDLRDRDARVTVLPIGSKTYYGFENNHFAIELYNPFEADIALGDFKLELRDPNGGTARTIDLTGHAMAAGRRFVITNGSAASSTFGVSSLMSAGDGKEDNNLVPAEYEKVPESDPPEYRLRQRYDIYLLRTVSASDIYLDKQQTVDTWFTWETIKNADQFYCRADNDWNIVYQDMATAGNTLGNTNGTNGERRNYNLTNYPGRFVSVGDIARALTVGPSTDPNDMIGVKLDAEPLEELVRLDLRNPAFAKIFQYLTVIDPADHGHSENETRIKGRINVNTAPWYVIAQLPWMEPAVAQAIVAYRD
ncbi:MAG: hypothetical protein ACYSWW_27580, partial [Planctomycetota bacterium]